MYKEDKDYFAARASREQQMAAAARTPEAAAIHARLAGIYSQRLTGGDERPSTGRDGAFLR